MCGKRDPPANGKIPTKTRREGNPIRRLRKVVFYLFLLAYLVACPLTILYALGYVVNPGPPLDLVETGLIHLATLPPGATVYLEGKRCPEQTPTALRKLLPGDYPLKLSLEGHQPWERVIRVEGEKAQALDKILLLPEEMKRKVLVLEGCETLIPIPGTHDLVILRGPLLGEAVLYNWKTAELKPLIPEGSALWRSRPISHETVPGSPMLLLNLQTGLKKQQWVRIDLENPEAAPEELPDLSAGQPGWITWSPRNPNRLFVLRDNTLERLDLDSAVLSSKIAEGVQGYGITGSSLVLLTSEETLKTADYDGKPLEAVLEDPQMGLSLFGGKDRFRIYSLPGDLLLFLGENGQLLTNRLPYRLAEKGVRGFQFDPQRERLLVWSREKIGIVDFSVSKNRERLFEQGPALAWAFEKGKDIQQAFWVYDGSHILFRDHSSVYLLEAETRDNPALGWTENNALHLLLNLTNDLPVYYSEESGDLFYVDSREGTLLAMEIIPRERPEE